MQAARDAYSTCWESVDTPATAEGSLGAQRGRAYALSAGLHDAAAAQARGGCGAATLFLNGTWSRLPPAGGVTLELQEGDYGPKRPNPKQEHPADEPSLHRADQRVEFRPELGETLV